MTRTRLGRLSAALVWTVWAGMLAVALVAIARYGPQIPRAEDWYLVPPLTGHALTMLHLQAKRPTLWDMEADLKTFKPPLLVLVGDEDDWCLDSSVFLKRTVPTAGLVVIPRSGHTITSEEPAAFNAALADLIANVEAGRWMSHRAP